ncbi:hypothetical protein [Jidongwangia harbinensis]|uniref:hypothetical protein n=1 Tax=Jidongwangia harbinensis TaxID=2878561 RepID=UPI001CD9D9F8|nr:hypothetical protein [Jidongwangia harbinensis]MCA2219423.1 hypothetical protein [Jidongwangia harbinensis]
MGDTDGDGSQGWLRAGDALSAALVGCTRHRRVGGAARRVVKVPASWHTHGAFARRLACGQGSPIRNSTGRHRDTADCCHADDRHLSSGGEPARIPRAPGVVTHRHQIFVWYEQADVYLCDPVPFMQTVQAGLCSM